MTPRAEAVSVTRRFGEVTAVDGVSLRVQPGEVVGLVGANGAGKTTLVRMLLGLVEPTSGSVRVLGRPPDRDGRRRIGYVPQGRGLYGDLTVAENLAFSAAAYGVRPPRLDGELEAVAGRRAGELPLGLARRAAFAAALAHEPELLVLDEPTSGVEPLARTRLWETIRQAADGGAGALVTTHYMDEAEQCDRLVVMADGRVVADGTLERIVGDAGVVEIRADRWDEAFAALDGGPVPPTLRGRALRLPSSEAGRARRALAERGIAASLTEVPATLEEAFVRLTRASAA
ncbi:MAG TPA: ABC transporter ATP-binding protein [Actinomycetes bacterium]|nr:ABC transporter ATP-binding protein [Actinomycetes bacterium]